jgi:para-nitrobenzyl esterase
MAAACALTLPTAALAKAAALERPALASVKIGAGRLAGVTDRTTSSWKAIPYAAPPVGALRWRPPRPIKAWSGVRAADKVGAMCPQKYNAADNGVGPLPISEDCLTFNVWAPAKAARAPVMVWIHGGGFVNGSGTASLYDGQALARQGVVVVTLNYRLGRLGFFAHPALEPDKGDMVGNYGLMDMTAALAWVRDNIAAFGGDPANVTLFGESAGGAAINALMASPSARGLFAKAIVQSGLGREGAATLDQARASGEAFAAKLGLEKASAAQLRALSAETIVQAGDIDILQGGGPMLDGAFLTMRPAEAFARGLEAPVPYVIGWNSQEMPVPAMLFEASMRENLAFTPQAKAGLLAAYPDAQTYGDHVFSDFVFVEPARNLARLHARNGRPTYAYRFSVLAQAAPKTFKGAPHATERPYVFQTLSASTWPTSANDAAQAAVVSAYWTNFAKSGEPGAPGAPAWPSLDPAAERIVDFTNDGPRVIAMPRVEALNALQALHAP